MGSHILIPINNRSFLNGNFMLLFCRVWETKRNGIKDSVVVNLAAAAHFLHHRADVEDTYAGAFMTLLVSADRVFKSDE